MELTVNDLETVFGRKLDNLVQDSKENTNVLFLLKGFIRDLKDEVSIHTNSTLRDIKKTLETLAEKIGTKQANGEKTADIKIDDVLNDVSSTIASSQKDNTEKLTSNFSYNFKSLNEQLKIVNDLSIESNREQLTALRDTIDQKIEKLTAVIQGSFTPQKETVAKKQKETNTATELLLTQQLMVLEKLKGSVDSKLSATLDAVSSTEKIMAKKAKRDLLYPPEISLSKKDRKLLQAIDANDEVVALTKEFKESKKVDPQSGIGKFLSPFLVLLGAVGAIAFAAFKFPTIKKMWGMFTQTKLGGGMMSFFQNITPKGMDMKEFIRGIPFIGRLVDLWDALDLLHQGKTKDGLKRLAFVVPGMEFLAALFGTSKERLLQPGYTEKGDESFKMFGFSFEQMWHGLFNSVDTVFKPVMDFFTSAFGAIGEGINLLSKGGAMNYQDIANTWDKIATDYFPSLRPVANIMKWLAKSAFSWTAGRMKSEFKQDEMTGEMVPLDISDVITNVWARISELFTEITNQVQKAFDYVKNIVGALGLVFSGEKGEQIRGLNMLEQYNMGSLADGLGLFLNVVDSVKQMAGPDGNIGFTDLVKGFYNGIDVTNGPFGRKERIKALASEKGVSTTKLNEFMTSLESKRPGLLTYGEQGLEEQARLADPAGVMQMTQEELANEYKGWEWLFGDPTKAAEKDRKWAQDRLNAVKERKTRFEKEFDELLSIPSVREYYEKRTGPVKPDIKVEEIKISPEEARNSQIQRLQQEEGWANFSTQFNNDLNAQSESYVNLYSRSFEETQKQTQALLDQNSILREQLQILKEATLESKKGNQYLEATTKGISFLAEKPQGPVVVNNSSRANIIKDPIGSSLSFKSMALNSRGLGSVPQGI